jgi:23S rRNA (cytidine2498-2'-O)-methyltransferase
MHILRCCSGLTDALGAELTRALPQTATQAAYGEAWRQVEGVAALPRLAFCRQALPDAVAAQAASINQWADLLRDALCDALPAPEPPWRLHIFGDEAVSGGRCALIDGALDARLQKRNRALRRARNPRSDGPWLPGEWLVQLALRSAEEGWLSICAPDARAAWGESLSPFPGGAVTIPRDTAPPSRAYQKLLEAELRLGVSIQGGERCVDLGASPGGWTFIALKRGATVTAIDRSPLRDDLMRSPYLHFVRGDAFAFTPLEPPVDWLLCDVIAFPAKTIEAIERWLTQGWCRRFCITIKFKGRDDDAALDALREQLPVWAPTSRWAIRHLDHNHNEVTLYGEMSPG